MRVAQEILITFYLFQEYHVLVPHWLLIYGNYCLTRTYFPDMILFTHFIITIP